MTVRLKVVVPVQLAVVAVEVVVPRVVGIPLGSAPVVAVATQVVEVAIGIAPTTQLRRRMNSLSFAPPAIDRLEASFIPHPLG